MNGHVSIVLVRLRFCH